MQTFTKAERLSGKIEIEHLFSSGTAFNCDPFRVIWKESLAGSTQVKIVISVPKRLFKKAVDRNRVKRLCRESYRKNKNILIETLKNKKIHLMFIYTAKNIFAFKEMEEKIITTLQRLSKNINS